MPKSKRTLGATILWLRMLLLMFLWICMVVILWDKHPLLGAIALPSILLHMTICFAETHISISARWKELAAESE